MSQLLTTEVEAEIEYPDTSGQPMGESQLQVNWILMLVCNINYAHRNVDAVIGADNYIYPVKWQTHIVTAPDVYVAYGRPKQDELLSYKVWEQGGTYPQVAIEILSKSNTASDREWRRTFHETYGCEEYIEIDPRRETLAVWVRHRKKLKRVNIVTEWISPRMGIRFVPTDDGLMIYHPEGILFRSPEEIVALHQEQLHLERKAKRAANRMTKQLAAEQKRAETEKQRAETEKQRAETEKQRADAEQLKREQFAAKLRELGVDPDTI